MTKKSTSLDDLLDLGEMHARTVLLEVEAGSMQPFYHLITAEDDAPDALIPCQFEGDYTKDIAVAVVTHVAREIGAVMVLFASEAWMATIPAGPDDPEPDLTTPPSRRSDRVEIVALIVSDGDTVRQRTLLIRRGEADRITGLERTHEGASTMGGRMIDGIIKPKVTH